MKKSLTQGFTLIELLVVIAIIGILAAVVLVAINPAQRIAEANDSKAKSNVGQVATAIEACYTASGGQYATGSCDSPANLYAKSFLKTDLTYNAGTQPQGVTMVVNGTTAALAYAPLTATSATCAVGTNTANKYAVYRTSNGQTQIECPASGAPASP